MTILQIYADLFDVTVLVNRHIVKTKIGIMTISTPLAQRSNIIYKIRTRSIWILLENLGVNVSCQPHRSIVMN